jgi:protein SCO1
MRYRPRSFIGSLGSITLLIMTIAVLTLFPAVTRSQTPRPVGGAFALTDQDGREVTERDLLGKPTMIFFGFTSCPDVCPSTLLDITNWLTQLGPDADRLNVVFVSVDSEYDTAARIKLYLSSFDPRIRGFVGTETQIQKITDAYGVRYKRIVHSDGGYTYSHSALIYLMDRQGRYVGFLRYEDPDTEAVAKLHRLATGDDKGDTSERMVKAQH